MNQDIREGLATGEYMVVIRSEYEKLLEDLAQKQSVAAHAAVDEFVLAEKEAELAAVRRELEGLREKISECKTCINANPDLMKLRRLEVANSKLGIEIERLQLGAKLGKDPAELVKSFKKKYDEVQPVLGEYWNLTLHELFVVHSAKMVAYRAKEQMSFSSSPLDKAICNLWDAVTKLEEREKEVLGF